MGINHKTYLKQCLESVRSITGQEKLSKQSTPTKSDWHPENYDDELVDAERVHDYRSMIGMAQWLIALGRVDIHHAISTLARYSHIATHNHFDDLVRVFEYLNKYPERHLEIRDGSIDLSAYTRGIDYERIKKDMESYYPEAESVWDPKWPEPKGKPVEVTVMVDADHATDQQTRRSKTGILIFIGSNLYKSVSKMQKTVADSTFSAEIIALGQAADETRNLLYTLRSLGIAVQMPIQIFSDSRSAVDNVTIPGSPLKKKHESIHYHKLREGIAAGDWVIYHLDGTENTSDINTKTVTGATRGYHSGNVLSGQRIS